MTENIFYVRSQYLIILGLYYYIIHLMDTDRKSVHFISE